MEQPASKYFEDIFAGTNCWGTDWYEDAHTGNHGNFREWRAPALLGFDSDIGAFCGGNCDSKNRNVLNMFGHIRYNMCRNFEWQMCAALGKLKGQNSRSIQFAWPPGVLSMDPAAGVFGTCHGYTDAPCKMPSIGFANDDIYYLEVCLYSQVCANRDNLFALERGQDFECQIDKAAFAELQAWLIAGAEL